MTRVTCDISVSVDGFVAGPRQSSDNPIGEGGMRLHEWHFHPRGDDRQIIDEWQRTPGAYIMGRNMFGPGRGEWDLDCKGWWGARHHSEGGGATMARGNRKKAPRLLTASEPY